MDAEYIAWLRQLPINRGTTRRSWVGIHRSDDSFLTFEQWQQRAIERDAHRGVIARWLRWLNS